MSFLGQPATQSGDDLDNLLRAFFQAEMPSPWPAAPETLAQPLVLPAARSAAPGLSPLMRSRLALAASVALLISGPLYLAGRHQDTASTDAITLPLTNPAADRNDVGGPKNYGSTEKLIQDKDGTHIHIDIFELPGK